MKVGGCTTPCELWRSVMLVDSAPGHRSLPLGAALQVELSTVGGQGTTPPGRIFNGWGVIQVIGADVGLPSTADRTMTHVKVYDGARPRGPLGRSALYVDKASPRLQLTASRASDRPIPPTPGAMGETAFPAQERCQHR